MLGEHINAQAMTSAAELKGEAANEAWMENPQFLEAGSRETIALARPGFRAGAAHPGSDPRL